MYLLDQLAARLPARARPYAKAITPAAATLAGVAASWAATGRFDAAEARTAIGGLLLAALTYAIPNQSDRAPD